MLTNVLTDVICLLRCSVLRRETTYDMHKLKSPGLFSSMFIKYFRTSLSHYLYHPTLLVQATVNLAFRVKWFPKQFSQIHSGKASHGSHNGLKRHGYIIYLVKNPFKIFLDVNRDCFFVSRPPKLK